MNVRSTIPLFLAALASGFAAAPEKLEGFIYYETGVYRSAFFTFEDSASVFAANGTFSQIYSRFNQGSRDAINAFLRAPQSGTFPFRKIDDLNAELSFYGSSFGHAGILRFDSASGDTGTFFEPSVSFDPNDPFRAVPSRRTFRLVPLSTSSRLINCSNRSFVRSGGASFAGFVVSGSIRGPETARMVLIRAIGPSLALFGVTDALPSPLLQIDRRENGSPLDDRKFAESAECIRRTSTAVGAFPLPDGSRDVATLINLLPGAYVAQATSATPTDSGQVLIEIYILP